MRKLKAVFFDFGGVLALPKWSLKDFVKVTRRVLKDYDIDPPPEFDKIFLEVQREDISRAYKTLREYPFEIPLGDALKRIGIECPKDILTEIVKKISEYEFHTLNEDAELVLKRLKETGYVTGVISNTRLLIPRIFLQKKGLDKYLDAIVLSREVGYLKPHPKIFEAALRSTNVKPEESMYVGDVLEIDVYGSKRLGMIGVLYGEPEPVYSMVGLNLKSLIDKPIEPDYVIKRLREVLYIITDLND